MRYPIRPLLLAGLLLLPAGLIAGSALAGTDTPPPPAGHESGPPSAARMTERMKQDLSLSDSQAAEVEAINRQFIDGLATLREQHHARLKRVLSSEQYESLLRHEQRMEERRSRRHERRPPPPPT